MRGYIKSNRSRKRGRRKVEGEVEGLFVYITD
jgi:hypothetical protein